MWVLTAIPKTDITKDLSEWLKSCENYFCNNFYSNGVIRLLLCTWFDSPSVLWTVWEMDPRVIIRYSSLYRISCDGNFHIHFPSDAWKLINIFLQTHEIAFPVNSTIHCLCCIFSISTRWSFCFDYSHFLCCINFPMFWKVKQVFRCGSWSVLGT